MYKNDILIWFYGSNVIFPAEKSKTQEVKLTEESFLFYKDNFSSSNLHSLHLQMNCEVKEKIIYFHVSIISISNCCPTLEIFKVPLQVTILLPTSVGHMQKRHVFVSRFSSEHTFIIQTRLQRGKLLLRMFLLLSD